MNIFKRTLRLLLFFIGLVAGLIIGVTAFLSRLVIRPPRQRPWANPSHFGLEYEDVQFPARDGVRLAGWFVPAATPSNENAPSVIMVHGWTWCRAGTIPGSFLNDFPGGGSVELLPLVKSLSLAGYHVLSLDMRNHGLSASSSPVTFGWREAGDVLGALDYLQMRSEVDQSRVGVLGFSMGANAALFALPRTELVAAALLVQPTSPLVFNRGYFDFLLGPFGGLLDAVFTQCYALLSRGLTMRAIDPVFAASAAGETPILYVQSSQDRWGSPQDVVQMARATPNTEEMVWVPGERFSGYQYVVSHPDVATDFFGKYLS